MRKAIIFTSLVLLLASCAAPSTPTQAPPAAASATPSATMEPSATVEATVTPEATERATNTPLPMLEVTVALIPTFVFSLPSPTPLAGEELDCQLISQSVANDTQFRPGERFSMGWNVMNTGRATWYPGNVTFVNIAGSRMQMTSVVQLKKSVQSGQTTSFSVDMKAPKNSSKYTTLWSLKSGSNYFCRVRLSIYVQ